MIDKIIEIDKKIMVFLNKTISNSIFDFIMPIITNQNFLVISGLILIGYLAYYGGKRGRITIAVLLIAAGFSDAICFQIIKPWVGRIRPSHEFYEYINLLVSKGGKYSFPSNHAANSFVFATVLSYFYDKNRTLLYILASSIAFSRVYVGVHYPLDIIFGSIIGYIISWIILSLWVIIKMRELKRGKMWVWYATSNPPPN
ncbi:MAG: hypothetical protein CMG55_07375 [Candidatus Marinimicrobia bacterium]|nr:hypothetical protein [Candidatus Neomarinimicrobiota bacterium]